MARLALTAAGLALAPAAVLATGAQLLAGGSPDILDLSSLLEGNGGAFGSLHAGAPEAEAQPDAAAVLRRYVNMGLLGMVVMWSAVVLRLYLQMTRGMQRNERLKGQWDLYKETQAEVVLCLKGGDPTLAELFTLLARQTHRAWHLRVVVHSKADPGWDIARNAIAAVGANASWRSAVVEPLDDNRPAVGSLKCAALRQAYARLQPETAVVVGVDGDAAISPDWLITLIAEVQQPGVGGASGNRWYEPSCLAPIDCVRAIWGTTGFAVMNVLQCPWGGSLAVRREVIEGSGWVKALETSFCEDTALPGQLWAAGWRFQWVPAICSVDLDPPGDFMPVARWIARQQLCAHMHHPLFPFTLTPLGIVSGGLPAATLAAAALAAALGARDIAATLLTAYVATQACCCGLVVAVRELMRRIVIQPLGIKLRPHSTARWVASTLLHMQTMQVVSFLSCVWCLFTTRVEWRGVVYRRTGHQHIHIESMDTDAKKGPGGAKAAGGDKAALGSAAAAAKARAAGKAGSGGKGGAPAARAVSMRASELDDAAAREQLAGRGSYLWASFAPSAGTIAAALAGRRGAAIKAH